VFSHDVKLPRTAKLRWPDRCVVCDRESPGHRFGFASHRITWFSSVTMTFGERERSYVPACKACSTRLRVEVVVRAVLTLIVALAIVYLLLRVFGRPSGIWGQLTLVGYAALGVVPRVVASVFFPLPFDVTPYTENIVYEFRSQRLAEEFAALNHGTVE
jgi:hypothetical protein